ncbi:DUF4282 domain-containing protein [Streptomonospora sp. S1-112]|uniref:DUF4282 domain-containing protein n=1 Tax=Streptomonospora mangrovi TaxID=2883123 RepID=A0A9X3SRH6_9ACTN|nr:DUF4282 domain-containing protein [Streptomonospora mangrovi]MDA0567326.1 DUF4282 domain-containing protein [Streptomonospora mangrovi]
MNPPGESPYEPGPRPYDPGASGPQQGWEQQPQQHQAPPQAHAPQQHQQPYAGRSYEQAPPEQAYDPAYDQGHAGGHAGGYAPPPGGPAPAPPPAPGGQGAGGGQGTGSGSGFLSGLFDLRFRTLVATQITRVLFVLALVLIGISTLSGIVGSFGLMAMAPFDGLLTLLGSLVGGAVAVLVTRVVLELVIVVFRIGEDLAAVRARGGR